MAGEWLFCDRRWLNPADPVDRARLESGYVALCADFPEFAACPRRAFLTRLAEVRRRTFTSLRAHAMAQIARLKVLHV